MSKAFVQLSCLPLARAAGAILVVICLMIAVPVSGQSQPAPRLLLIKGFEEAGLRAAASCISIARSRAETEAGICVIGSQGDSFKPLKIVLFSKGPKLPEPKVEYLWNRLGLSVADYQRALQYIKTVNTKDLQVFADEEFYRQCLIAQAVEAPICQRVQHQNPIQEMPGAAAGSRESSEAALRSKIEILFGIKLPQEPSAIDSLRPAADSVADNTGTAANHPAALQEQTAADSVEQTGVDESGAAARYEQLPAEPVALREIFAAQLSRPETLWLILGVLGLLWLWQRRRVSLSANRAPAKRIVPAVEPVDQPSFDGPAAHLAPLIQESVALLETAMQSLQDMAELTELSEAVHLNGIVEELRATRTVLESGSVDAIAQSLIRGLANGWTGDLLRAQFIIMAYYPAIGAWRKLRLGIDTAAAVLRLLLLERKIMIDFIRPLTPPVGAEGKVTAQDARGLQRLRYARETLSKLALVSLESPLAIDVITFGYEDQARHVGVPSEIVIYNPSEWQ